MANLIQNIDGRKAYIGILSDQEIQEAEKLLDDLINSIPILEDELEEMYSSNGQRIAYAHAYGTKLHQLLNDHQVKEYQKDIFFKQIRHFASQDENLPKDRSESRAILEYYYRLAKYPFEDVSLINWSEWSQLFDIPAISEDDRILLWLLEVSKTKKIPRDIFRELTTGLRLYTKNKDLSFLSAEQLNQKLSVVLSLSVSKYNLYNAYFNNRGLEPSKARLTQKKKYREKYFTEAFQLLKNISEQFTLESASEQAFIKVYQPPVLENNLS